MQIEVQCTKDTKRKIGGYRYDVMRLESPHCEDISNPTCDDVDRVLELVDVALEDAFMIIEHPDMPQTFIQARKEKTGFRVEWHKRRMTEIWGPPHLVDIETAKNIFCNYLSGHRQFDHICSWENVTRQVHAQEFTAKCKIALMCCVLIGLIIWEVLVFLF